jgi:hypothetical protein
MRKNKNGRHRAALALQWVRDCMVRQSPHWDHQTAARRYGIPIEQKRRRVKPPTGESAR